MKRYIKSATSNARYTIKSVSDEGTYFLVKDWRKNKELWVSKEKMDRHPEWWFTSSDKAKQSLKSLLSVMDEYLTDTFTVIVTVSSLLTVVEDAETDKDAVFVSVVGSSSSAKAGTTLKAKINIARIQLKSFFTIYHLKKNSYTLIITVNVNLSIKSMWMICLFT
jgi:hypothetical protein